MTKNYIKHGFVVLSSLAILSGCQPVNTAHSNNGKKEVIASLFRKKEVKTTDQSAGVTATSANPLTEARHSVNPASAEQLFNKLFESGDNAEQTEARKQYLVSITKPEENVYAYLADRKAKKEKGIRPAGYKKGIEEMAEYRRQITMPVGTDKMLYEEGYLMKEFLKAEASPILARAEKARFAPAASSATTYSLANVTFTERGPNNIPGRDRSIVPSPTNPDKWYVGSVGGGVWITDDAGKNWRNTTDYTVPSLATSTVAISANNPNVVYVGSGEPFGNLDALNGVGLIKSTDGGTTWTRLLNTVDFGSVGRLLINPADANHLLAGTSKGIYVTKDGGATWSQTLTGTGDTTNAQDLQASADFSALYASVNSYGILKSTDGGSTWTKIFDAPAQKKNIKRIELAVSPSDNNRIFLSAEAGATIGMYLSDDAGATFSELTYQASHSKEILGGQGWYDNLAAFNPLDKNVVYVGGVYLAKVTIDPAAKTYTVLQIASGYTADRLNRSVHPDQHGLVCQVSSADPTKFRMLLTNDGGVYYTDYKTNPGETEGDFFGPVKNLNTTQLYGVDKKKGEDIYVGGAQDNGSFAGTSTPASAASPYTSVWGGDGFEVLWNYNDPKKIVVGSQYNNFVTTITGVGGTLYYARNADGGNSAESPFYSKLANVNNNPDAIFTVAKRGVWRSVDFGASWKPTTFNTATNGNWQYGNQSAATVKVSAANPDVVWAGAVIYATPGTYAINISKDNGQTFAKTTGRMPLGGAYFISGLAASRINEARAFVLLSAAGQPKILKTDDYGANWRDITGFANGVSTVGFPNVSIHSVLEMPFDEKVIWAGTDIGVFETIDGGASWYLVERMPPVSVWDMKIVDGQVVMATHGRGIWTATIPELANEVLPLYASPPIITSAGQAGIHDRKLKVVTHYTDAKITSLNVYVNNTLFGTIPNTTANTAYTFVSPNPVAEGVYTVAVSGIYDNGAAASTGKGLALAETIKTLATAEVIDFNPGAESVNLQSVAATDMYIGPDGKFVVDNVSGKFTSTVLNNFGHPYANGSNYQTYLRTPIVVGADSNHTITHIALTEAGDDSTSGYPYDPAIVEASKDLQTWVPVGVWSESSYTNWMKGTTPLVAADVNEGLFQNSALDFTSKFTAGDEVAVRLRLKTDPAETRYGWVIKSFVPTSTLAANEVVGQVANVRISPNPAKDETAVYLPAGVKGKVTIAIFDASGKTVSTVVKQGASKIDLDVRNLPKGVYLVLVKGDDLTKAVKLLKE